MVLTPELLTSLVPTATAATINTYAPLLALYLPQYKIDTPARIGGFMAQILVESANLTATVEEGPNAGAQYEGRKDLGNTQPGDGVKFKGRGLIQITGRGNYQWCGKTLYGDSNKLIATPELLAQPDGAVRSACWYWTIARPTLNYVCDQPENYIHPGVHNYTKIQYMTLLVNGGENDIVARTINYRRAQTILGF